LVYNTKIKKDSLKYFPIFLFTFFPYITLYSFGSDIQPWGIMFICLFVLLLFLKNIKFNLVFVFLLLPGIYSILLLWLSIDKFSAIRSVLGYLIISLVPLAFYYILKKKYDLFVIWLKITTVIYLVVALVQIAIYNKFMLPFLNRISTTEIRGVTSLTPEPTFYGIVCLFLILIFLVLNIENKSKYIYMLLFQIVFLAQSSMTILFLIIFCFYYFIFKMNIKIIFLALIIISMLIFSFLFFSFDFLPSNARFIHLMRMFLEDPSNIFIVDASINDRVSAIYFSLKGFFDNYLIANGFGNYMSYLNMELSKQNLFWWVSLSNRIMSFYGSILFELGFIGLLIPIIYSIIIFKAYKSKMRDALLYMFFFNTILFSAIPLSFPFIGVYIAALLYRNKYDIIIIHYEKNGRIKKLV